MKWLFAFASTCVLISAVGLITTHPTRGSAQPNRHNANNRPTDKELEALPTGVRESLSYMFDIADRIAKGYPAQSVAWRNRAQRFFNMAQAGRDPFSDQGGKIVTRGYQSPISTIRQGYSVYIPPKYDPKRAYPLMIVLHGGSSNGNLFLGVVLGNNMNWLEYPQHLWDEYTPRLFPDWIVVAPDGFGQVMWRWMGEQDVLDVVADVQKNYHVDPDRVVLTGLSNGGVGAYSIGLRQAWRFSHVVAIAGAPSWIQYSGGSPREDERIAMQRISGFDLAENAENTRFLFFHGHVDPGPMKPRFVEAFEAHLKEHNVPHKATWFDAGHDILYMAFRQGKLFERLGTVPRNPHPSHLKVVTADYRANRQHWLSVTGIEHYPSLAHVEAVVKTSDLEISTKKVTKLRVELIEVPFASRDAITIRIDGKEVYRGAQSKLGSAAEFDRFAGVWALANAPSANEMRKLPGLSGPLSDAYFGAAIHVYGTGVPKDTDALKATAERGARGWPLWLWNFEQRVIADKELTDGDMANAHIVLYGTPGANAVLERMRDKLPIQIKADGVHTPKQTYAGSDVGARFVYPSPKGAGKYVIVQAGMSTAAVNAGHNLPDFVPDYVIYNKLTTKSRPRLISNGNKPLAAGYFSDRWQFQ